MQSSNSMYWGRMSVNSVGDNIFTLFGTGKFPAKKW